MAASEDKSDRMRNHYAEIAAGGLVQSAKSMGYSQEEISHVPTGVKGGAKSWRGAEQKRSAHA